jgi:hypothetical protein
MADSLGWLWAPLSVGAVGNWLCLLIAFRSLKAAKKKKKKKRNNSNNNNNNNNTYCLRETQNSLL